MAKGKGRRLETDPTLRLKRCPVCGRPMSVGDSEDSDPPAGSRVTCPYCSAQLEVLVDGELGLAHGRTR